MKRIPTALLAAFIGLCALATSPVARAQAASGNFILDEYNVDAMGGPDSSRVAVGLSFGSGYGNGWWWTGGPRVSWLRWDVDIPQQTGFGVGGTIGGGWRPDKVVSPYAAMTLDYAFSMGSYLDGIATLHAGARVRVTPDPREHFTMTFSIYRAQALGGDGPGGGDFGVAVLYSAVLQAKKR